MRIAPPLAALVLASMVAMPGAALSQSADAGDARRPAVQVLGEDAATLRRMVETLRPANRARETDVDYINRIIQQEIVLPGGTTTSVRLNYNHTLDLAVFFAFDSARVTPRGRVLLRRLGEALANPALDDRRFLVAGHTDAKGRAGYNQSLSERRARAVRRFLTKVSGLRPARLIAVGFGERRLADAAAPHDGINRRVEITMIEPPAEDAPVAARTGAATANAAASAPAGDGESDQAADAAPVAPADGATASSEPRSADANAPDASTGVSTDAASDQPKPKEALSQNDAIND